MKQVIFIIMLLLCVASCKKKVSPESVNEPLADNIKRERAQKVIVVPDEHPTIQVAIDASERGTIIHIKPGDYKETLTLKSGVSLKGLDANEVLIHCDVIEGPVLSIEDCNSAEVSDLTLKHTGLKNRPADFKGRFPVLLLTSSQVRITQCKIQNGGGDGIVVNGGSIIIRRCSISNNKLDGICIYGNARVVLEESDCSVNGGNGIHFIVIASGNVSGNTCSQNAYNGISGENDRTTINLLKNTCEENKINGIYFGSGAKGSANSNICRANGYNGIVVTGGGTNAALEENIANNNNASGIYFGDRASGSATDNKCSENLWHGISIADDWSRPKVSKNHCFNNKGTGLYLGQSYRARVGENNIHDNGEFSTGELVHLLFKNKFSELDSIASLLRAEKRRYKNGTWQLHNFYFQLGGAWIGRTDFSKTKEWLQQWIAQQPNSITPRIVLAQAYRAFAWQKRGGGYANEVSETGWEAFKENLQKAQEILVEAEELNTQDPSLYATWLEIGRGLQKSDEEMDALFEKGIAIEKNYWPLYTARGFAITPIWGGKRGELEAFARHAVELTRQKESQILYAKIAHLMIGKSNYEPQQYKQLGFSYKMLKQSHDDLVRLYPSADDNYLLNASCFLACAYGDRENARDLFARIGTNRNKRVWRSEETLKKYKDWAFGKTENILEPYK